MSAPAEPRYRVDDEVVADAAGDVAGRGYDVLLGRPVSVRAVPTPRPERLARELRMLLPSPWVQVLDAIPLQGRVLVVMPAATGVLAETGPDLEPARAQRLAADLDEVLADLARRGLAPLTADPSQVGVTADGGVLLVPGEGPPVAPGERRALLAAVLSASAPAAAPTAEVPPVPPVPPVPEAPPDPPAAAPTAEVPVVEAPTAELPPVAAGAAPAAPAPARGPQPRPAALRGSHGSTRVSGDGVGMIAERLQPATAGEALGGARQWPERLGLDEGMSVLPASRVFAVVWVVGVLGALVGAVAVLNIF